MAKGFKHGAGGGTSLNFKVICNPQPETAKENTIWVDTDRINNYYFSATQPENMAEYDVWFPIGISSTVEFNALKKNGIQVYPQLAKQYIGGTLVDKTAKSWQNGAWVELWDGTLYEPGNTYDHITGGWGLKGQFDSYIDGTFAINADSLSVTASGTSGKCANFTHYKKVDLTDFSLLSLEASTNTADRANVIIADAINNYITMLNLDTTSRKKYTIDLSNIKGEHYIAIGVWFSVTTTSRIDVYNMKLIR